MVFDTVDFEFLRLAGICRYLPSGLSRRYNTPLFKKSVISNLKVHRLIKLMNDKMSYKLTKKGRDCLAEMGMSFSQDARTDLKKASYQRKLKNAHWNVLLLLAGIDVYYEDARQLATANCGYLSSLLLRAGKSAKVIAGARFLGILKIADTVYIPYYVETEQSWIYPKFEKEMYQSQINSMTDIKDVKLILIGESLEELWRNINHHTEPSNLGRGMKTFNRALEEFVSDFILIPFGRDGLMQMSVMKICGYRERLASALGCKEVTVLSECDGIKDGVPYIIAIDCNVTRIVNALRQVERYDKKIIPRVCCLPFQKSIVIKTIKKYNLTKSIVTTIPVPEIYKVFPEISENRFKRDVYMTREGGYIEVYERNPTKDDDEDFNE